MWPNMKKNSHWSVTTWCIKTDFVFCFFFKSKLTIELSILIVNNCVFHAGFLVTENSMLGTKYLMGMICHHAKNLLTRKCLYFSNPIIFLKVFRERWKQGHDMFWNKYDFKHIFGNNFQTKSHFVMFALGFC